MLYRRTASQPARPSVRLAVLGSPTWAFTDQRPVGDAARRVGNCCLKRATAVDCYPAPSPSCWGHLPAAGGYAVQCVWCVVCVCVCHCLLAFMLPVVLFLPQTHRGQCIKVMNLSARLSSAALFVPLSRSLPSPPSFAVFIVR